jgi:hypothetical protein
LIPTRLGSCARRRTRASKKKERLKGPLQLRVDRGHDLCSSITCWAEAGLASVAVAISAAPINAIFIMQLPIVLSLGISLAFRP